MPAQPGGAEIKMINSSQQIWLDFEEENQYAEFLHIFNCNAADKSYTIEIYSETEYVLYINKQPVGFGQYKTFADKRVYDSYDVTELIVPGENSIELTAYHQHTGTSAYAYARAGVCFALFSGDALIAASGSSTLARPCSNYESGKIELVSNQLGYIYHYDARAEKPQYMPATVIENTAPFVPRPVPKLKTLPVNVGKLLTQGILMRTASGTPARMMQSDFLSFRDKAEIFEAGADTQDSLTVSKNDSAEPQDCLTVRKNGSGVYFVIDLQEECAGILSMEIDAPEGTRLDIGYGEHLDDMRVRTSIGDRSFAASYICKGGTQSFDGYFRRFACRYIQVHITNMTGNVRIKKLGLIPTEYPFANDTAFSCDDYLYNRIVSNSVRTLKLCVHEHYEDCPWREQALYAFDSMIQMLCGYYAFGEYKMAKASLALLADGQLSNGLLRICAPAGITLAIPSFSLCWIITLKNYVLYSGDLEFGKKMLPAAEKILDFFKLSDGLVCPEPQEDIWCFFEWSDGLDGYSEQNPLNAPLNMYCILACEAYNEICTYINKEKKYSTQLLKAAVKATFFDAAAGLYKTELTSDLYHELTQSLAILCGLDENGQVLKNLTQSDGLIKTTLSTSFFKYEAILSGSTEYLDLVLDEIADIWGRMVFTDTSTLWETINGADDFAYAGSLCHAWSAVPVYVLYRYVLGYKPDAPGFEKYSLSPVKTKCIKHISAALYTPNGEIKD